MKKILVIEDETSIRENILDLLDAEDFQAIGAENGKIGIQLAMSQMPDLILCDVMMPEIDGYGVLKALRGAKATATIPFIFLTALADKGETRKGMELGADDYLTKPCTPDELLKAIAIRLDKRAVAHKQSQEKLDELRSQLAMTLPHELRTPLNGILSASDFLLADLDDLDRAEIREMLQHIRTSGQRLYRLIQNFLLYAELELLAKEPARAQALQNCQISSTQAIVAGAAREKARSALREADLQLDLQEGSVLMAGARLKKLVEELVENAFKFSKSGTPVTVTTRLQDDMFILSVRDKGRGMTAEQIAEIGAYMQFERKVYEQQGSGLGLAIARRLAELHGGQLTIESIPNQQTTVAVALGR